MPVSGAGAPVVGPAGVGFAHPATPPGHWAAVPTAPHHTVNQQQSNTGTVYTGGSVPVVEPMQPPQDNRDSRVIPVWNVAESPRPGPVATPATAEPAPPGPAPTPHRRSPMRLIVAGVVAAWIIIAAVVVALNLPGGDSDTKVPNVTGRSQDDAATQLRAAKLEVGSVTYEESADVPENMIIRTVPAADKQVNPGTKITLVLARAPGSTTVTVPDLAAKTQDDATNGLTAVGLTAGEILYEDSTTVAEGTVIRTEPAANAQVAQGSAVKLYLAQKPGGQTQQAQPPCTVPDVAHKQRDYAEQQMKNAGISYQIKKEESDHVAVGTVIRTDPGPGRLEQCRRVTIVVSQGVPIHVPDVVGDPEGYAKQQITDAKLKASVKYSNYCGASENQEAVVKSQSPGGGSTAHEGDTVTITVPKYTGPCASNKTTNNDTTTSG
jgi:serine/threonine-protein kinase